MLLIGPGVGGNGEGTRNGLGQRLEDHPRTCKWLISMVSTWIEVILMKILGLR